MNQHFVLVSQLIRK